MRISNWVVPVILALLCNGFIKSAAQPGMAMKSQLDNYVDSALKNNPALRSYKLQSRVLQQKIKPERALDDPMIYAGVMNMPVNFHFRQDEMTMNQVGIQQNFSIGRKYALKGMLAEKEYELSNYDIQAQKLLLIYKVKAQYYDLYAQTKAIETTLGSIEVLKNYVGIANARYSTAQGGQQDVLKAQLQLSKMQTELVKMEIEKTDMAAIFNTLLARKKSDPVIIPEKLDFMPEMSGMDSLTAEASKSNPMVLQAKLNISRDSASYLLSKASRIPDFNAGAWYGQRNYVMPDGTKVMDMVGFQFGLTLPVFSKRKQNPMVEASKISIEQSQSQLQSVRNETELMLHHAMSSMEKNRRLITLYEKQLIPQAEQTLNSGIIGYQENKIDFMTLTDNFMSLYTERLQLQQAITDYCKAKAELEMITGQSMNNDQ